MFYTYILANTINNRKYIGSCLDPVIRLKEHNSGKTKSTKHGKGTWFIIYQEFFLTRGEACKREKKIKAYKGGNAFKKLIHAGLVHW